MLSGVVAFGMILCCGSALAQDKKPEAKPQDKPAAAKPDDKKDAKPADKKDDKKDAKAGGMSPEDQAMMQMMMEMGKPSDEHKKMAEHAVGNWDVAAKWWMGPGDPMETKATAKVTALLGGRFFQEEYTGDFMGQPFNGMGISGYDRVKKEYFSTWMDNMGTSMMMMTGKWDEATKSCTYTGEMCMPDEKGNAKASKCRSVLKVIDNDKHIFEMYEMGKDGKENKTMELTYTRKKG